MNKLRDPKGKYAKKPNIGKRIAFFTMFVLLVVVILLSKPQNSPVEPPKQDIDQLVHLRTKEAVQAKIEALEDDLLSDLSIGCETLDLEDPDGAIVYDTAAKGDVRKMSIGRFQWQRETIKHYVKIRDGIDITNAQAIAIAIDPEKSTDLARYVIFERGELKRNWYNCTNKLDLDTRVDLIKKLYE